MDQTADSLRAALGAVADPGRVPGMRRFFRTGPGEYGEGDVFVGITMPALRRAIRPFGALPFDEIDALLDDAEHEHRLAGVLLLVRRYPADPDATVARYLAAVRRGRVDNWDLVDASSEFILGPWLREGRGPMALLDELAVSDSVWERRVAVLATFDFIRSGDAAPTLALARRLLDDRHDLIRKAVGWMLREVGKRVDRAALTGFLDAYAAAMPRTMLAYATEHLTPEERTRYRAM